VVESPIHGMTSNFFFWSFAYWKVLISLPFREASHQFKWSSALRVRYSLSRPGLDEESGIETEEAPRVIEARHS